MKTLLSLLLAVLCAASLSAATGTATITFTAPQQAGVEYFAEQRTGPIAAPVWVEVAKGPASPLVVTMPNVQPGVYTYRVRARLVEAPTSVTAPTNDASGVVLPGNPSNAMVTFTIAPISP